MASIRKLPSGKFFVEIRRKGLPHISRAFATERAAQEWARKIEVDIDNGVFHRKLEQAQVPTVQELLDRYEKEITPGKRGSMQEKYRLRQFQNQAFAPFATKPITAVTEQDIIAWRDDRLTKVSADTVRREMVILGAFFNQCGTGTKSRSGAIKRPGWRLIQDNPVELAGKPAGGSRRKRRVSEKEIEAIAQATGSAELAAFIHIAVETAMRRGEIAKLVRGDVMFEGNLGYVKLHEGETKNGSARSVPLTPAASAIVLQLIDGKEENDRLFTLKPDSYTQAFIRARRRARQRYEEECKARGEAPDPRFLTDVRLHDNRHEGTSRLFEVHKLGVMEAAEITGHKDLRMLRSYSHQEPLKLAGLLAKAAPQRYVAVAKETQDGYEVWLPDFPGVSMKAGTIEKAAAVASALMAGQSHRPVPTPIEVVARDNPGCRVFFVQ
ncbi:MAG: site-specific integrase [Pseudomonadota bacterium]|jgi:integrase